MLVKRKERHLDQKLQIQKEKPKHMPYQKVWLEARKLMTGSETDPGKLSNDSAKTRKRRKRHENSRRNVAKRGRGTRASVGIGREFAQGARRIRVLVGTTIGRPNKLSTKIWKMMQSNNTKSENLESVFTEILEKAHLLAGMERNHEIDQTQISYFGLGAPGLVR